MHPLEGVRGNVGLTARKLKRVRGPPPDAGLSVCARMRHTIPFLGYPILNAPRFETGALEGFLCTQ